VKAKNTFNVAKNYEEIMRLSKDYKTLFRAVWGNENIKIPCFVNYSFQKDDIEPCRDIAIVRFVGNRIMIGARGIEYGDWKIDTADKLEKDCLRMNLEWVE
jgi:hypothetical protein